jgi:predicted pyridoxine 5'-phosphate oxidase superfamily flavin-nucleotide-binding protein
VPDPVATPSELYGEGSRALQDELDTRRLADRLAGWTLHQELTDDDTALIRAQPTVWIATVDAEGWPDVSYKGGDPGFVEVVTPTELRIPSYDGNGMMRTLGNIVDTGRVALLFVDMARPWRMRLHGAARVSTDLADTSRHHGAQAVIIVDLARIFPNCGRYIHKDGPSEFVPRPGEVPPLPEWKQYEGFRDVLPPADLERLNADPAG